LNKSRGHTGDPDESKKSERPVMGKPPTAPQPLKIKSSSSNKRGEPEPVETTEPTEPQPTQYSQATRQCSTRQSRSLSRGVPLQVQRQIQPIPIRYDPVKLRSRPPVLPSDLIKKHPGASINEIGAKIRESSRGPVNTLTNTTEEVDEANESSNNNIHDQVVHARLRKPNTTDRVVSSNQFRSASLGRTTPLTPLLTPRIGFGKFFPGTGTESTKPPLPPTVGLNGTPRLSFRPAASAIRNPSFFGREVQVVKPEPIASAVVEPVVKVDHTDTVKTEDFVTPNDDQELDKLVEKSGENSVDVQEHDPLELERMVTEAKKEAIENSKKVLPVEEEDQHEDAFNVTDKELSKELSKELQVKLTPDVVKEEKETGVSTSLKAEASREDMNDVVRRIIFEDNNHNDNDERKEEEEDHTDDESETPKEEGEEGQQEEEDEDDTSPEVGDQERNSSGSGIEKQVVYHSPSFNDNDVLEDIDNDLRPRRRGSKPEDPCMGTESISITESNLLCVEKEEDKEEGDDRISEAGGSGGGDLFETAKVLDLTDAKVSNEDYKNELEKGYKKKPKKHFTATFPCGCSIQDVGIMFSTETGKVKSVKSNSLAGAAGVEVGMVIWKISEGVATGFQLEVEFAMLDDECYNGSDDNDGDDDTVTKLKEKLKEKFLTTAQ